MKLDIEQIVDAFIVFTRFRIIIIASRVSYGYDQMNSENIL